MRIWMSAVAVAASLIAANTAKAFPPTATTSPGYDRALAESRRARQAAPPIIALPPRYEKPRARRHERRD